MKNFFTYLIISFLLSTQNLISGSILSSIGLGMPFEHPTTRSQGMGYISIANIDPYTISKINPASLFIHKSTRFAVYYLNENNYYKDQLNGSAFSQYSNFDGFNFIIPLHENFGFAANLTPLTRMNYHLSFDKSIETINYTKSVKGNGGLNALDLSWYWSYKNKFSFGMTGRYIFGNLNTTWRVNYSEYNFTSTKDFFSTKHHGFNYKLGILIQPLNNLTMGTIYTPAVKLDFTSTISHVFSDSSKENKGSAKYPGSYGFGISYNIKKIGLIGIEYFVSDWKSLLINGEKPEKIINTNRFSVGFETSTSNNPAAPYYKQIRYRLGFSHSPYFSLDLEGNKIHETWLSCGFGFPFKGRLAELNIALNYGKRGSLNKNGISENLFRISAALSIGEKWFQRRF